MDQRFESIINDVSSTLQESIRGAINKRAGEIDSYWKKVADEPGDKTILNTIFPSDDEEEKEEPKTKTTAGPATTAPKFNDTDLTYVRNLLTQNQEAVYKRLQTFNYNGSEFKTNDPLFTILQKAIK